MSATNSTTNYSLPLFVPTDKPAWLVDWNGAMSAIDTAIKQAQTAADMADTDIGTLQSDIVSINAALTSVNNAVSQLRLDTNSNTGAIHTIQELIGNGTPTTTDKTIIGAINELHSNVQEISGEVYDFDIKQKTATATTAYGTLPTNSPHALINDDSSVGKIYGSFKMNLTSGTTIPVGSPIISIAVADLSVSEAFDVEGYLCQLYTSDGKTTSSLAKLHFNTNGTVDIVLGFQITHSGYPELWINLPPCLLFLKNLGD